MPLPVVPDLVISASRLTKVGGEKDKPGCERKYCAEYLFGLKQGSSRALVFGSALHKMAEIFQETGSVVDPEGEVGEVFRSGVHLLDPTTSTRLEELEELEKVCNRELLVEHEHWGLLPDGTEFIAYLDGHSSTAGTTGLVVVQDLKTTGDAKYALNMDPRSLLWIGKNIQAMFYAWILMCCPPHWFCPPLPGDEHYGPKHWQIWDPTERGVRGIRLRWLYFLTRGAPRAWDVTAFVTSEETDVFMRDAIMPLVEKIKAAHAWRAANPTATLNEIDRNLLSCSGRGQWCGAGEVGACDYATLGTPVLDLIQLKRRPIMTPAERLAALRNKVGAAPAPAAATPAPEAPKASEPAPAPAAAAPAATAAPAASVSAAAPIVEVQPSVAAVAASEPPLPPASAAAAVAERAPRTRRRSPPATPPVDAAGIPSNVNPPETLEVLAALQQDETAPAAVQLAPAVAHFTTEQLVLELVRRAFGVAK